MYERISRNRPCNCHKPKFTYTHDQQDLSVHSLRARATSVRSPTPSGYHLLPTGGTHSTTRSQTAVFECNSRSGHLISPISLTKWRRALLSLSAMQPVVVRSKSRPTGSLYSVHNPRTAKTKGHNEYRFYSATLTSMKTIALSKQLRQTSRSPAPVFSLATAAFFSGLNTVHYLHYLHYLHRVSVLPAC